MRDRNSLRRASLRCQFLLVRVVTDCSVVSPRAINITNRGEVVSIYCMCQIKEDLCDSSWTSSSPMLEPPPDSTTQNLTTGDGIIPAGRKVESHDKKFKF
jgi:hypothetical protein